MNDQAARQLAKNAEKVEALLWQYPEGIKLEEITAMNRAYLAKFKAVITYKPIFGLGEV